jgi:hypothetical protein
LMGFPYFKNATFKCIFQDLSKNENTAIDAIVLMLNDTRIAYNDTPASVDLQICDILGLVIFKLQQNLVIKIEP